ncbi:unnamed protein product [Urochloa humidicola]
MNPKTKIILEELSKRFDEFDSKWDARFSDSEKKLETRLAETEKNLDGRFMEKEEQLEIRLSRADDQWERRFADLYISQDARVSVLERAATSFDEWRPDIEGSLEDIRLEVHKISKNWERAVMDPCRPPVLPLPSAAERPPATSGADRPSGHRVDNFSREDGFGSVTTLLHPPDKGACDLPVPPLSQPVVPSTGSRWRSASPRSSGSGRLPKLNFPTFDGENPKLWLSRSEDYFELYDVEPHRWIMVASMHFTPAAARWLSSVEHKLKSCSWQTFSSMVLERFGRNQHELLVRQLFHIKQTSTVAEYIEQFAGLVDQLAAYESKPDPSHYTMWFIDGLRDDLRAAVLIQRPSDLDTAYVLSQLQEEVSPQARRNSFRRSDYSSFPKTDVHGALPLPAPPRPEKASFPQSTDRRGTDASRARSAEDRWAALRAHRRAQGLCQKCAEPWTKGHTCAEKIQLNAVDEILEAFMLQEQAGEDVQSHTSEQLFLTLSLAALDGIPAPRTMCLLGCVQGHQVRILVDSGSSHTFVSSQLASQLKGVSATDCPLKVQVANGSILQCSSQFLQAEWSIQGYQFSSDLKVLPLSSYDMILGLDWLEAYSPMKIHWKHKWISIPYNGSSVLLYGILPELPADTVIQVCSIDTLVTDTVQVSMPDSIQELITQFGTLFEVPTELPPPRSCDHTIPLVEGAAPVFSRPYRYAPALKDEIEKQNLEMLKNGVIQPSTSPFSSSVLLVKKKDNTWRFCVDYRFLNAITVKGKYPVPVIDEFLDELFNACWFTKLDLTAGFHQIRLKPGEEYKTAFQTHFGHFEFRVMAFGLTGAPGTFQSAMNITLAPYLRKFVLVFFDDILIYSRTLEEHIVHIKLVFELLDKDQWKIKLSKCSFAQRSISYLGHTISEAGVGRDPEKIAAISTWPTPTTAKELRSFLGLAGYYRKFIRHFGIISKPLTDLLKKYTLFVWTVDHEKSFQALKKALTTAPVLALPDFSKIFCIETDASAVDVGAVLLQDNHPLAFISKALGPKSKGLSTYEKEYLAIIMAVQQWRYYLQHAEFLIYTDQRSLVQLNEQRLHTHWQQKVFTKLLGLQYRIIYKQGVENRVADALSRKSAHHLQCNAISSCVPQWIRLVLDGYQQDEASLEFISKLTIDPEAVPHFTLRDGLLRYKSRIWIGQNPSLQQQLMAACHSSPVGGHSGAPVTYMRMKKMFAWKGMKTQVHHYVQSCMICQKAKPDRSKLPGKLQPLPVPSEAWQIISMDFVEGLPNSGHANCILVVVDSFTKYAHFIPLHHPFTAAGIAKLFISNVYKLHGLPQSIISDRDRIFNSQFWRELFGLAGVDLLMSSSYHPQTDGQTERLNQTMETFLRCFANACPSQWIHWLSLAEFWYNTSDHSAIGRSPFVALYGYSPKHFGLAAVDSVQVSDLSIWLQDKKVMQNLIKQHLSRAKLRMKKQADKGRSERTFNVGDLVFLKLQPYVQSSLAPRANQKLAFKYFGPCRIISKIGQVAYKLELPSSSSIHPVFHVSQLKKAVSASTQVLPHVPDDIELPRVPARILQKRLVHHGVSPVQQVLVQWSGWPESMATWEGFESLKSRFPRAPAWGQAASQEGGMLAVRPPRNQMGIEQVQE